MAVKPKQEEPSWVIAPDFMIYTVSFAVPKDHKVKLSPKVIADIERAMQEGLDRGASRGEELCNAYCCGGPSMLSGVHPAPK